MRTLQLECGHATDHVVAASLARHFALGIGFDDQRASAVAIVVGELVSNAVRHAGAGRLELLEIKAHRPGLEITVSDRGPGIGAGKLATIERWAKGEASQPETSLQHELNHGLGAVMRLVDSTKISSTASGTTITACCYVKARR